MRHAKAELYNVSKLIGNGRTQDLEQLTHTIRQSTTQIFSFFYSGASSNRNQQPGITNTRYWKARYFSRQCSLHPCRKKLSSVGNSAVIPSSCFFQIFSSSKRSKFSTAVTPPPLGSYTAQRERLYLEIMPSDSNSAVVNGNLTTLRLQIQNSSILLCQEPSHD